MNLVYIETRKKASVPERDVFQDEDGGEWGRIMKGSLGNAKNLCFYSEHSRNT